MPDLLTDADLDRRAGLLRLVGSFWADTYQGVDLVSGLLFGRGQLDVQADLDFQELLAAISRHTLPLRHTDVWYALDLLESERNAANLPRLDRGLAWGTFTYDTPLDSSYTAWKLPAGLADVRVIASGTQAADTLLTQGIDYFLQDGLLFFREDPFILPGFEVTNHIEDGQVVDRRCRLWLYRSQWDHDQLYVQFGYAIGLHAASTSNGRALVNAVYDSLCDGPSLKGVEEALAAATDSPLAAGGETVENILTDARARWVVTDKRAYRLGAEAAPAVAVGDFLVAGAPVGNAFSVYEFNQAQALTNVRAVVVGRGFLDPALGGELVFENKSVPLVVEPAVAGFTKVSFALGGRPADVEDFWALVHAAGVAKGQTLAMLLDQRTAPLTQPTELVLPRSVNPLEFLINNVFRNNVYLIQLRLRSFGPDALGFNALRVIRRMLPPHTACLLLATLEVSGEAVIMNGPGTDTTPGYTERASTFIGQRISESVDPADFVSERVRLYQVHGQCH